MAFRTSAAAIGLAGVLLLAGCGGGMPDEEAVAGPTTPLPPAATAATEPAAPTESDAPPPVTVRFSDESVALQAWTYRYRNVCADGAPPAKPADVGSPEEVLVEFPVNGTLPTPQARLAFLANPDGPVDSYGVELELTNLAATPKQASARITVRAANGAELTFDAVRSDLGACRRGPPTGTARTSRASRPADEIEGNEPSVALRFTPELPAL